MGPAYQIVIACVGGFNPPVPRFVLPVERLLAILLVGAYHSSLQLMI